MATPVSEIVVHFWGVGGRSRGGVGTDRKVLRDSSQLAQGTIWGAGESTCLGRLRLRHVNGLSVCYCLARNALMKARNSEAA